MENICSFRFKAIAAKSKLDLVSQGFTEFTIEDFHNTVRESVWHRDVDLLILLGIFRKKFFTLQLTV